MLHIYYGRESVDKDRFLFSSVKGSLLRIRQGMAAAEKIYVVVPDQFTLQAEQNALTYLEEPGLLEVDILSQSRFGHRILLETAGATRLHIDKYGRHMLLAEILKQKKDQLRVYGGAAGFTDFVEMVNDLIVEMKQHNIEPQDIPNILESIEPESLLYRKLADIYCVFEEYQERISGKYVDTEDYTRLVTEQIPHSAMVRNGEFWIYGFDSFTPKMMDMLGRLMACAVDVNVVMIGDPGVCGSAEEPADGDLFRLAKTVMDRLRMLAIEQGTVWEQTAIGDEFLRPARPLELVHLERQLYAWPHETFVSDDENAGTAPPAAVAFCRASNLYTEAESAAAEILRLVRECGYRYEDIAVICNDMEGRGSVISRVFHKCGIPVFLDCKRSVLHNPAVEYIMALLEGVSGRLRYEEMFRMVKTGLTELTRDEGELLENYVVSYKSAAFDLQRKFRYGESRYGSDGVAALEEMRQRLVNPIAALSAALKEESTGRGKTRVLYEYLTKTAGLPEKLKGLCDELEQAGEKELLLETAQIWQVIVRLLDQIVELVGEENISMTDYAVMLNVGFSAVEIGLLPPSYDQVIVGTMQRTRTGRVKAVLVLGANDGLLPSSGASEELLSEGEKALLLSQDIHLCREDSWRASEEKIAIYKNLSKPSQRLWMSYTVADGDGGAAKASLIYEKLRGMFPQAAEMADVVNGGQTIEQVYSTSAAGEHLAGALQDWMNGDGLDPVWKGTLNWFLKERPAQLRPLQEGIVFDNRLERLERDLVRRIYKKEGYEQLVLSPSRLERFSRCPFQHFMQYGLRPEERRVFELAGREVGDVYHQCLMQLSQWLTDPQKKVTDPDSLWMTVSRSQCEEKVSELMERIADSYGEAVLRSGGREEYRLDRMKQICSDVCWAMIQQVRCGEIEQMYLEAGFGRGKNNVFPAMEVPLSNGESLRIEGRIDRVDVLPGQEGDPYVKVIDYKSGREAFRLAEAKSGWRLQLMLYLQSAVNGMKAKPAGVFYFLIGEPSVCVEGYAPEAMQEKVAETVEKGLRMNGLMVNEPQVIQSIAGDFEDSSSVVPLSRKRDGTLSKASESFLLPPEEFDEFRQEFNRMIGTLCQELAAGEIAVRPVKTKSTDACQYCNFKSVCYFDPAFRS